MAARGVSSFGVAVAAMLGAAVLHACGPSLPTLSFATGGMGGAGSTTATVGSGGMGGGSLSIGAGGNAPPPPDAGGLCGNQIEKITTSPPNVYFVLDTSGSMAQMVAGGTKYQVVQHAAVKIATQLRFLIKVGATTFPGTEDQCAPGTEVFPVTFDDPAGLDNATANIQPVGGTPTAATLSSLQSKLAALPGKTVIVLATDGGPNCNLLADCDAAGCVENIEGCIPGDTCCAQNVNCCAPGGPAGPQNCVDEQDTVQAIGALAAAGLTVYVLGVPGSATYEKVLADMALAGGAALAAYPFYYAINNIQTIGDVFTTIAAGAISCTIQLAAAPQDPSLTNVYFDQTVVLSDPANGWSWSAPDQVTLNGAACAKLQSGAVGQVQVVSGCPTMGTK